VWLPRRAQASIGNAIDRHATDQSGDYLSLEGSSTGLNARTAQATRAELRVGSDYVAVARIGVIASKVVVEVFQPDEIMSVQDGDTAMTGVAGFMANKNAGTNLGQALGWTADTPGLVLQTERGDVTFTVRPKYRGELRRAYLAIADMISDTGPQ
jgi:hypothetical protein